MKYSKGQSGNLAGRPKGCKDKIPQGLAEAYVEVFEELGGAPGMLKWAKEKNAYGNTPNKAKFYELVSKLLPRDFNVHADTKVTYEVFLRDARAAADNPEVAERLRGLVESPN